MLILQQDNIKPIKMVFDGKRYQISINYCDEFGDEKRRNRLKTDFQWVTTINELAYEKVPKNIISTQKKKKFKLTSRQYKVYWKNRYFRRPMGS